MRVSIPNKFQCLNRTVRVRWMDDADELKHNLDGDDGYYNPTTAEVVLRPKLDWEYTEHTFYHELTHMVLESAGRMDLSIDENLVDAISGLFHQFLSTKRGNIKT